MKQVNTANTTAAALKQSALMAVGLLVALCAMSVATAILAMSASVSVARLAVLSSEQQQLWAHLGRLVLYRPPPQTDKSVERSLLAELRADTERLLKRSQDIEAQINSLIDTPLKLVLANHEAADWPRLRANANISADLQRKFAALPGYPDDLLILGMETWGSDMQVAVTSGDYLKPLIWFSDRTGELAAIVQSRTTIGLAAINLVLIVGSVVGWRRILVPTYRQWEQGQMELLRTNEEVMARSAQFQGAFSAITDAACLLGKDGRIVAVNLEFSRMFRVSAYETGTSLIQDVLRQAADKFCDLNARDASSEVPRLTDQDLVAMFDGRTVRLVDDRNIDIRLSKAGPDSWLFIAQIQGDAERNLAKKLHNEHLQQLGIYSAGVAHDLNNMLGTISGRLKMFRALPATPENISDFLGKLDVTLLRGVALVSDLLKFLQSSTLQPVFLSASQLEQDLAEFTAVAENVTFTVKRSDNFVLHVDRRQLLSALENICKNSRDAIGDRPGVLAIDLRRIRPEGSNSKSGYACISIQDTGGGFSQVALDRAFDPFFSTKGFGHGTGLGLAIVKGFIEQSGGDIQIRNVPGGARVEVFLPSVDVDRSLPT